MIIGGYPSNTDRAEIEESMRAITEGSEGVIRSSALGRYGGAGRVYFDTSDSMWNFIKANKGTKFDFDGTPDCLWYAIEKTSVERDISKKVGFLMKNLVAFLIENKGMLRPVALKLLDGDYTRGCIVYVTPPGTKTNEAGEETKYRKKVTKIMNSNDGYAYTVTNAAREIELLKDFPWGDTLKEVNDLHNAVRPEH